VVTAAGGRRSRRVGGISYRTAAWLAWSLCAISLVLTALALWLLNLNYSHPDALIYDPWLDNTLSALSYTPVGALIASRRPANPLGWLLCLFGLVISISHFGAEYAIYAQLARSDSLPAGEVMAWILSWLLPIIVWLSLFPLLLFPTGKLPSRHWRWLGWLTAAFVLLGVIFSALSPGALMGILGPVQNPLGVEGFSSVYYLVVLYTISFVLTGAVVFAVFMRLWRSAGVERQQVKWFAYAAAASAIATILAYVVPGLIDMPLWFERMAIALNIALIPATPIAIGIAILRYRLYDIDIIINRTLVYGTLTVTLLAVYFGGVATAQLVLRTLTGQERAPQLAVVISTLVIAALFNPARRRVQDFIDRRFYRRKYDARKTLAAFSKKLRDETDVDALNSELLSTVRETVQPEHVSLWLREPEKSA
jgi:uncharacterized membrane protein YhdT